MPRGVFAPCTASICPTRHLVGQVSCTRRKRGASAAEGAIECSLRSQLLSALAAELCVRQQRDIMTDCALFRSVVLADLSLLLGQIGWSLAYPSSLEAMPASNWLPPVAVVAVLGFALLTLASTIGLLFFRRWARPLYVASLVAGLVLIAFDPGGPAIRAQGSIASLNMVFSGMVIGLMYFSPARRAFEGVAHAA